MPIFSFSSLIVIATALIVGIILLFYRPLIQASWWRAIITPLASIMGSGFLVCAPLLYSSIGNYAVWAMAALLVLAFGVGSVIRFNIRYGDPLFRKKNGNISGAQNHRLHVAYCNSSSHICWAGAIGSLEKFSHVILIAAYCISVSYYLQLLASFTLHNIVNGYPLIGKILVTLILAGIGIIGTTRGLKGIERVERIVVGINLAMITALLAGLVYYNLHAMNAGVWELSSLPITDTPIHLTRVVMGMLIVVQGFETSRFLGSEHSADERIHTMRWAQLISTVIYLLFLSLMALVMSKNDLGNERGITAIISLSGTVSVVLPLLLTLTAVGSQFSAATADDAGGAGLLEAIIGDIIPKRYNYLIISGASVALTWLTNVYEIISYASRAFALFYALQCALALLIIRNSQERRLSNKRMALYAILGVFCLAVSILGIPAE